MIGLGLQFDMISQYRVLVEPWSSVFVFHPWNICFSIESHRYFPIERQAVHLGL